MKKRDIPKSLRIWFIIHFIIDMLFAIPLLFFSAWTLNLFGFSLENLLFARLVGAALIGIGGASFLVRDKPKNVYLTLIDLKILWSLAAILAIIWSIIEGAPKTTWLFLAIFVGFSIVWQYYKIKLK
jgi:hypothetical protein